MPAEPRHSKPRTPAKPRPLAVRLGAPVVAAVTLAGVAAAFVFLQGGSAPQRPTHYALTVTSASSGLANDEVTVDYRHVVAATKVRASARAVRRKYVARLAAARRVRQQAAQQQAAAQQAAAQPTPTASPTPAATLSSGGGNAASSPLGVCIRNAEQGGSYAWGPGNGGGAYQFQLGTWENYGGAASQYGVAGPAYQDQIFNNAIAAGGASNWTAYDGC
jgi:hypothetical protein